MKDLVISKTFGSEGEYIIQQLKNDTDDYALKYIDDKLKIEITIFAGGDTDGGSIPNVAKGVFDPLLDRTAHGFIFHDELWRHRVLYKSYYESIGLTFSETNRIMKDIHKQAGCGWVQRHTARLAVQYFGFYKWNNPDDRVKNIKAPTLNIKRIGE